MKKYILSLTLIAGLICTAQAQDSLRPKSGLTIERNYDYSYRQMHDQEYYLKKSQRMNSAGLILLSLGSALTIGGIIVYNNAMHSDNWVDGMTNSAGGYLAIYAGSAMVITSIPILIVAGKNKKKAMELSSSIDIRQYQQIQAASYSTTYVPSLSIKLGLP